MNHPTVVSSDADRIPWQSYILELDTEHPYNPRHQIARVSFKGRSIDLRVFAGVDNPNPRDHLIFAMAPSVVWDREDVPDERLGLPPGLADANGLIASVPQGFCWPIDRQQKLNTTNPQNSQAGFSISETTMFDMTQIVLALSPRFGDRDYTTIDEGTADPNANSIGIFINNKGVILIKSAGGSITLGKEGVHIGGRLFTEASAVDTGVLSDNSISDLIPSTIPTAAAAYPKLPNFGQFANIANAGMKFVEVTDKAKAGINTAKAIGSLI
jgi:hypothetical protein